MDDDIKLFAMVTDAGPGCLWLPAGRARTVDAPLVFEAKHECENGGPGLLTVIESAGSNVPEPVASFPYAPPLEYLVSGWSHWKGVPPHPLPPTGWHEMDEGWWCDLAVRGPWVYVAQTQCDDLVDLVRGVEPEDFLRWGGPGRAFVEDELVTWNRVRLDAWDRAWHEACEATPVTLMPEDPWAHGKVTADGDGGPTPWQGRCCGRGGPDG